MTTRTEIMEQYEVDGNLTIRSPGKFEAESAWAPYFYEASLDGTADTLDYPDGVTLYVVSVGAADRAEWPEIGADIVAAVIEESESGFVSCMMVTQEELDSQEADRESANDSDDSDDSDA